MGVMKHNPPSATNIIVNGAASSVVGDDTYDDACELGQFVLNPAWYICSKLHGLVGRLLDIGVVVAGTSARTNRLPGSYRETQGTDGPNDNRIVRPPSPFVLYYQRPLYFTIMTVAWAVILLWVYPLARAQPSINDIHLTLGYLMLGCCILSWIFVSTTPSGTVTLQSIQRYNHYVYDGWLYRPEHVVTIDVDNADNDDNKTVTVTTSMRTNANDSNGTTGNGHDGGTMNIDRDTQRQLYLPARTKYDRYSQQYVPRFDHYCGWLQRPIGEENYRQFLLFVLVHTWQVCYGCIMVMRILILHCSGTSAATTTRATTSAATIPLLAILAMFLVLVSGTMVGFSSFHLYLVANNVTTYEYFRRKRLLAATLPVTAMVAAGNETIQGNKEQDHHPSSASASSSTIHQPVDLEADNDGTGCIGGSMHIATTTTYVNCSTINDINTMQRNDKHPHNIYNLGLVGNITEVLFPKSLYNTYAGGIDGNEMTLVSSWSKTRKKGN